MVVMSVSCASYNTFSCNHRRKARCIVNCYQFAQVPGNKSALLKQWLTILGYLALHRRAKSKCLTHFTADWRDTDVQYLEHMSKRQGRRLIDRLVCKSHTLESSRVSSC